LYAPRYAGETHVVYEIQNEPEFNVTDPSSTATMDMQLEAMDTIRKYAPNTHVLMMSYGMINKWYANDIEVLENAGIDLKDDNQSIAYHGYYWAGKARVNPNGTTELEQVKALMDKGYAFTNTESDENLFFDGDPAADGELLDFYENTMGVSWLSFFFVPDGNVGQTFKDNTEALNVSWCPDFGTWPEDASTCHGDVPPPPTTYTLSTTATNGDISLNPTATGNVYDDGTTVTATATQMAVTTLPTGTVHQTPPQALLTF
jgi:hypothetical protein